MRTAIRKNLADFLAILGVVVLGIGIGAYILANQRLRFPLDRGQALHRQGRAAGRPGGHAGPGPDGRGRRRARGRHRQGRARGRQGRRGAPARAEVPRPAARGRQRAAAREDGHQGHVPRGRSRRGQAAARTAGASRCRTRCRTSTPTSSWPRSTRTRATTCKLLISGAGKGLDGRGTDLREVLKRLGPLHKDLARVSRAVAERRQNMRRLINRYGLLMAELGKSDKDITRLVRTSNVDARRLRRRGPEHLGARVEAARHARTRRPRRSARSTRSRSRWARPSSRCGRRSASSTRPTPPCCRSSRRPRRSCEKKVRPFARAAQPFQRNLGAASKDLADGGPGPDDRVPRAQPPVQHRRLQPGRHRGHQRGLRDERRLHARGARAQRGLPVLARLGRPEHRLAVLDGRRARPDPARVPAQPELRRLQRPRPSRSACRRLEAEGLADLFGGIGACANP